MTAAPRHALSVLIASRNRRAMLERSLEALGRQTQDPRTFEVIVADDGSTDGTAEAVERLRPPFALRTIRLPQAGQAAAQDAAMRAADGEICLFLDDDVIASPELVAEHIAAHRGSPGVLGVGALTQQPPARDWFARAYATVWNARYEELTHRELEWDDCFGGNLSAPRTSLLSVDGFATDLPAGYDIELAFRLWRDAGCVPVFLPKAHGLHDDQKRGHELLAHARRFGAICTELVKRDPAMCSRLVGWFERPTPREVILRRALLAVGIPPTILARAGRLMPGRGMRRVWCGFVSRYAFWSGVRANMSRSEWSDTTRGAPVLMYHAFSDGDEHDRFVLPKRSFARQMRLLALLRYCVIGFEDLARTLREGRAPPRRAVVITIDDGYCDVAEIAEPILRRHRFPATVFVVSGMIGGRNAWDRSGVVAGRRLISHDEMAQLQSDRIGFGAHTRSHRSLVDATDEEIATEIAGSRRDLEAMLRAPVTAFAYPYGRFDRRAVSAVSEAGFVGACTARSDLVHLGSDPLLIPRIEIHGSDSTRRFLRKLLFGGG